MLERVLTEVPHFCSRWPKIKSLSREGRGEPMATVMPVDRHRKTSGAPRPRGGDRGALYGREPGGRGCYRRYEMGGPSNGTGMSGVIALACPTIDATKPKLREIVEIVVTSYPCHPCAIVKRRRTGAERWSTALVAVMMSS